MYFAAMKQRYKCTIEYEGTNFVGWQIQKNGRSVQGEIQKTLEELFRTETRMVGAGRTDAGVHARGQVAHFDAETDLETWQIRNALNARMPQDITIHTLDAAPPDFHARFSASSRSYSYSIHHRRTTLDRYTSWIVYPQLNHEAIQEAVRTLYGLHDFSALAKQTPAQRNHLCYVFEANWEWSEARSRFFIRANRFLHGMVRCIVGGLISVGRGKSTVAGFREILEWKDPTRTPMLAPSHGLTLEEVRYDRDEWVFVNRLLNTSIEVSRGYRQQRHGAQQG